MQIWLFGEGNTDVTTAPGRHDGALRILLRRLLEKLLPNTNIEIVGKRLPRLHGVSGYTRKVHRAINEASVSGAEGIAIVVDRDGPRNAHRLALLKEGRELAAEENVALALHCAVGVAVEMLEAWLIADTAALATVGGVCGSLADPESDRDPKSRLDTILANADRDVAGAYDAIASIANLGEIQKRCGAFRAFADEVARHLAPK